MKVLRGIYKKNLRNNAGYKELQDKRRRSIYNKHAVPGISSVPVGEK